MNADSPSPKPPVAGLALTDHDALPPGTRFGEFEINRVLGVGGFGIVYLAQDHSLERQVALKEYMPAALAARGAGAMVTIRAGAFAETFRVGLRSFINESRLLARFDHPSLVKVYRFWEDNGTAYMVMPYLQGRTLRDARRAMGHAPDEAWIRTVLAPVLDALELLHREGVFHRDIAPDNILLPPDALPILLDFGAARRVISDRTQSLTAILKPSYAPIEQYAEMAAMRQGPWTDLYALGAVLHYLLFGEPPAPATARAVQPDAEQIEQRIVPGVSPRFMSVVAWMLGVRPIDRPQSVASLRAALNGELPVPASVRHDVASPAARPVSAPMPASVAPATFAQTSVEPRIEPTALSTTVGVASASVSASASASASLPGPQRPPTPLVVATPAPAAPTPSPGSPPMRSTPPGAPPQAYVPPPRAAWQAAPEPVAPPSAGVEPPPVTAEPPRRRGLMLGGALAALVVAAGVLWQFIGTISAQRPVLPPLAAASAPASAARPGAAGAYGGPTVAQVASAPQWGRGAATTPTVVAPGPAKLVDASAAGAAAPALAAAERTPLKAAAARADETASGSGSAEPPAVERRTRTPPSRVAQQQQTRRAPAAATGPRTAREACGDRRFIALAICIDRECERPRFRETAECVRVLEVKRRRAER